MASLTSELCRLADLPFEVPDPTEGLSRWHDHQDWPQRPLRVGLVDAGMWAEPIASAPGLFEVQWLSIPAGSLGDASSSHRPDACLSRTPDGGWLITTLEHADREAAWYDWGSPRPLSFPSVFPARLDPAKVTLAPGATDEDPALLRGLIEAAALLSRHPARLDLDDRLFGRRPLRFGTDTREGVHEYAPPDDVISRMFQHLAGLIVPLRAGAVASPAERAAARAIGAWAAAWPGSLDAETRRHAAELAASMCPDEADSLLRVASVRFGCLDDAGGLDAMARAAARIRTQDVMTYADPSAFLHAELHSGQPGPWTTGRLAAAVCLVAASVEVDRLSYFRDDLMDDLRHSPMLIGREPDERLVREVFTVIERARRADERGLPGKTAA